MTWLVGILIVVVMGGIAALAAGKGRPMATVYDDRPDALVPRDGDVRGADLRRVRFSLALRGYRMAEVDELLDRLAWQLERRPGPPPPEAAPVPEKQPEHETTDDATHDAPDDADAATDGAASAEAFRGDPQAP